jgi:transcription elongation factor Elf1
MRNEDGENCPRCEGFISYNQIVSSMDISDGKKRITCMTCDLTIHVTIDSDGDIWFEYVD